MSVVVVLVEPAGPLNVGSVARRCANFAISQLRLVAPRCDHLGPEARQMAVHGEALLEQAGLFPSLAAALADCRHVVATSGRIETEQLPLSEPRPALAWLRQGAEAGGAPAALVFGREDRGLSNDELLLAGRVVRIATGSDYPSLNLSHAVAVLLHDLHGQRLQRARPEQATTSNAGVAAAPMPLDPEPDPARRGDLEATLSDAEALLLEAGFLYPHTAHARMAKVRGLLQRAQINSEEVALLRGMVRQLRWATRQPRP